MDLVDFIGLNNSSIIFRAMNNACRLSHIQPSGTRQVEIKDGPDGKWGEAKFFVKGTAEVYIILEDAENALRFDEEYELFYEMAKGKNKDFVHMKLTNRNFCWIAEGSGNKFVYSGRLSWIETEEVEECVIRFKFNKTLGEGMKNGKCKLRLTKYSVI
jgi:hypothetical protein